MLVLPAFGETLRIAVIRVAFQPDDSPATTGDGSFVLQDTMDLECPEWSLDPPPHDKVYFKDHITAASYYWQKVSNNQVSVDTSNSEVFPVNNDEAYLLPFDMLHYHPYLEDFDETGMMFEMSRHAISLADADIDFNKFSTVIIAHAGMGGDFAFALDPTPGNIPSAYLSQKDFTEYGLLQTDEGPLDDLIIIPESQNFQQYAETRTLFEGSSDPCFYQVGLNGTIALLLGFHLDLPPLYNTESGQSLVGGFALMDQGSNNFHGVVPAYPSPSTRIEKGWLTSVSRGIGDTVALGVNDDPIRIDISADEYYLIENRQRNLLNPVHMTEWIDSLAYDTVSVITGTSGVVLDADEQHAGLPGNGLNIWHIDESARSTEDNPNGGIIQMVDFVEADGAQDMGHKTQLLFADYLETGWWFDPWFAGNEGWFHLNRDADVVGDSLISFNSHTFPSTRANNGEYTHLRIDNISKNGSVMSFSINSDRVVNTDAVASFIGWGEDTTLWAFNTDSSQIVEYSLQSGKLVHSSNSSLSPDSIFNGDVDNSYTYRYPWIVPTQETGVKLFAISSGSSLNIPEVDSLFELTLYRTSKQYFGKQGDSYVNVWHSDFGQTNITTLSAYPLTNFIPDGSDVFYGDRNVDPFPAATRNQRMPELGTTVIYWSSDQDALALKDLSSGTEKYLSIEKPLHIIPMDADDDGIYEIALFYSHKVKIINQAGVAWNGSPFMVESYFGNPLIATIVNGKPGIFLRHSDHYSVYSFAGALVDHGLLPHIANGCENSLRKTDNRIFILSGHELLNFKYDSNTLDMFWTEAQGNMMGDRTALVFGMSSVDNENIKQGSVYNYPNPIKGNSTTIRAWLGDVENWSIEIFSLNGSQVAYMELDVIQANGYNEWVWDASGVSNGVYLAHVVAGDKSDIVKIAVIR